MSDDELTQKGLLEAFNLQPDQLPDAKQNLLGFFDLLLQVDKRLNPHNYQPEVCSIQ